MLPTHHSSTPLLQYSSCYYHEQPLTAPQFMHLPAGETSTERDVLGCRIYLGKTPPPVFCLAAG
jgi:hypothetical protein